MERFVLLAYADHADNEGNNIYPALATIARKTGLARRSVIRIRQRLIDRKIMIATEFADREPTKFRISLDALASDGGSLAKPSDRASLGTVGHYPSDGGSPKPPIEPSSYGADDAARDRAKAIFDALELAGIRGENRAKLIAQLMHFEDGAQIVKAEGERVVTEAIAAKGDRIKSVTGLHISRMRGIYAERTGNDPKHVDLGWLAIARGMCAVWVKHG